jgi:MFS family permease
MKQIHPGRYIGIVAAMWGRSSDLLIPLCPIADCTVGVMTLCTGFVRTYGQALGVRFLCGMFESMFWPAMLYFLMHFYKRYELQRRYSCLLIASIFSGAFGGVSIQLAVVLEQFKLTSRQLFAFALAKLDGRGGLAGWRWIYIVEGLLTIISGAVAFFIIPDWPEKGSFLSVDQKSLLAQRLGKDVQAVKMDKLDRQALQVIFSDWKIYVA